LRTHWDIRHQVFVVEQAVFVGTDEDAYDADSRTVHVVGYVGDRAAGAVRLYPLDTAEGPGRWQGDRLAVLADDRAAGLGAPLVRHAVATATALGGTHMVAHIQLPNVRFFEHLGWSRDGDTEIYVGIEHQPMIIRWA
jgi:putative N-acetyltransferase (TIGR04045 family)